MDPAKIGQLCGARVLLLNGYFTGRYFYFRLYVGERSGEHIGTSRDLL